MPSATSTDGTATEAIGGRVAASQATDVGARLGRYLVIEALGRGGMGIVLRAYDPKLQREVALKLVRTDALDASAQSLVREARAMARLNHPNVVAIYDVELDLDPREGGVVVVMEYVPGPTLRAWLQAAKRSRPEILDACSAAGRGLAAAHAEGLLHRDFKPDNVLVGDDGRVRVTDFGLARAADTTRSGDASDERWPVGTVHSDDGVSVELTEAGVVMGTPPYMAPEQTEGGELDARTDQYAFCVATWRALTERWPFEGHGAALLAKKRAGPPRWPSDVPVARHVADALRRGLSPTPDDRWPSVPELLAALSRDPGRRRRRFFALGFVATAGVLAWGLHSVQHARIESACAEEGERAADVWNDARAEEIATAFAATDVPIAADTWSRARTRLSEYADAWRSARTLACERVDLHRAWSEEQGSAARSCLDEHLDSLSALLDQLSQPDAIVVSKAATAAASMPLLSACTDESALGHRADPPADPAVREQIRGLAARLADASAARSTGRYDEALAEAQAVLEEANVVGWVPLVAEARLAVGGAYEKLGKYDEAREALEQAFFEAGAAGRDELAMEASSSLVFAVGVHLAEHEDGIYWGRIAQMLADRLGHSDDLMQAQLLENLGGVHYGGGDYPTAISAYERALAIKETVLGPDHPDVAVTLANLGSVSRVAGHYARALELHERALAILQATLGPDHLNVGAMFEQVSNGYAQRGDYEQALAFAEKALTIRERILGPDHPEVATSFSNIGAIHRNLGNHDRALQMHERALGLLERTVGPKHPHVATSLSNIGAVHLTREHYAMALASFERALAIWRETLGEEHPNIASVLNNMASAYLGTGDDVRARELLERVLALRERALGPSHLQVAQTRVRLADALWKTGGDRKRAVDLATAAREAYAALGKEGETGREHAERWLTEHALP